MKRLVFLDWLRILATIAVVTIHLSAGVVTVNLYNGQTYWLSGNLYESISRWCVPMFVMVSGALLLNDTREYTYKSFLVKRVSKVFIPLLVWSFIYYSYFVYQGYYGFSTTDFLKRFSTNGISIHFWFVYMILGLYLITPLLKIFVRNASKKDIKYFLLLWFYISVVAKLMRYLFGFSFNIELYFVTNYVGYYILGYYLLKYEITLKWRYIIYFGGLMGLLGTFFLTYLSTIKANGALQEFWYEYHSPNVLLVAIGIFIFFKYSLKKNNDKLSFIPKVINNTSFGIYLVHMLVINILANKFSLIWINLHPALGIPYKVTIIVFVSAIIVIVIKKIPYLNKLVA